MMLKLEFSPRVLSMISWGFFLGGGGGRPPWKLLGRVGQSPIKQTLD